MTYSSVLVLQAIARGYRYGFDIMEATGLPSGTVYPALRRLRSQSLVTSAWEDQAVAHRDKRPRRRYYRITARGRNVLAGALQRFRVLMQPLPEADTAGPAEGDVAEEMS